jgi:Ca-activated chloride channel family protein
MSIGMAAVLLLAGHARAVWPPSGQFAAGVDLVEVYATVTDRQGLPIGGLTAGDFRIEEDGRPQTIAAFAHAEFPLTVALAVDRSFSVSADRLTAVVSAGEQFLDVLRPTDQVLVLAIGSEVETVAPLSTDRAAAGTALRQLRSWGTTPLYDAVLSALAAVQPGTGRRALILLSDGDDRYSRARAGEVVDRARRGDALVYPVAIGRRRPAVFAELATVSGGRSFQANTPQTLDTTLRAIAGELRMQYLLGYSPPPSDEARAGWRSIRVAVNRPGLRVRARDGYFVE